MKFRASPFDIPSGSFVQAYSFRLLDEAIRRMIKEGIPFSEYEKVLDRINREVEEEERKLAEKKAKATKGKPSSGIKKPKKSPPKEIDGGT